MSESLGLTNFFGFLIASTIISYFFAFAYGFLLYAFHGFSIPDKAFDVGLLIFTLLILLSPLIASGCAICSMKKGTKTNGHFAFLGLLPLFLTFASTGYFVLISLVEKILNN